MAILSVLFWLIVALFLLVKITQPNEVEHGVPVEPNSPHIPITSIETWTSLIIPPVNNIFFHTLHKELPSELLKPFMELSAESTTESIMLTAQDPVNGFRKHAEIDRRMFDARAYPAIRRRVETLAQVMAEQRRQVL